VGILGNILDIYCSERWIGLFLHLGDESEAMEIVLLILSLSSLLQLQADRHNTKIIAGKPLVRYCNSRIVISI